jgi:hypothetical protein
LHPCGDRLAEPSFGCCSHPPRLQARPADLTGSLHEGLAALATDSSAEDLTVGAFLADLEGEGGNLLTNTQSV